MNKEIRRFSSIVILLLASVAALAQDDKTDMFNPVNYSVTSQMIAPDARAAGLGDVGAATDPDVNSQFWNPAKYPFTISRAGVALNYTPWLRQLVNDIDLANLTGYYRIGDYSAISGSLRYFSLGEVMTNWNGGDDYSNAETINPGWALQINEVKYTLISDSIPVIACCPY